MNPRGALVAVFSFVLCCAGGTNASPAIVMGELGESMANQAWCGSACQVVDTHHGRHGIDFLFYENNGGQEQLHVAEVKSGGSQPNQLLKLSDEEVESLRKQGIQPEKLPSGHYKVPQGTYAYNLVQMQRKIVDFNKLNGTYETLKSGGNISKQEAKRLAQHFENMKLPLDPYEEKLLRRAKDKGDIASLNELIKKRQADLTAAQQQAGKLLQKAQADVKAKRYVNQLMRVTSKDGRFSIVSDTLDQVTGQPTGEQSIKDVNWKNYRESGPFRRLVKEQANGLCKGNRQCVEQAYKAAMTQLEQNGNMNQAMQAMEQTAKSPAPKPTTSSPSSRQPTTPSPTSTPSPKPASTLNPGKAANAAKLRKVPLLTRVKTLMTPRAGSALARLSTRLAPVLTTATAMGPAAIGAVAVAGTVMAVDAYVDEKLEAQTEKLKEHFGAEFQLVNENIGFVKQDLATLGEQVDYKFALTLETLDRHTQAITGQLDDLDQQMAAGFSSLSETLLVADQKQNYGIALQEAQFDDALQAGLKHYDVYLGTDDAGYLETAEREFTTAQARYENLLNKGVELADLLTNYRTQHALASYYRVVAYGELAITKTRFTEQAVKTFTAFLDQIHDPVHLESVLPIVNYAYASIADLDSEEHASYRLTQAYGDLIDHYLDRDQHNQARAYSGMLTMILDNDDTQRLDAFVRYVTGMVDMPDFDPWEMDERWIKYVAARESPKSGTVYALLACSEHQEAGEPLPDDCSLSSAALVAAADKYDNEIVHRYLVKNLLATNRVPEAENLIRKYYISDTDFRIRSQINIANFKRNERGENVVYCEITDQILTDTTYPDDLRRDVAKHRERWGSACSKKAGQNST